MREVEVHPGMPERLQAISFAMAYIEMPEEKTVMTAKEQAFTARVFSSKRSANIPARIGPRAVINGIMKIPTKTMAGIAPTQ